MPFVSRKGTPNLTLVKGADDSPDLDGVGSRTHSLNSVDWSILMARAQAGDSAAYRRLLEGVTPYLRKMAARRHSDPHDIEDAVQDILLTIHAVRGSYDPTRPFAPWLAAIAGRRLIDRLRRQGRLRRRETPLAPEHETFSADQANLGEEFLERQGLHEAISALPDGQRQAIEMLKLKEMSLKDASAISGLSVAALKVATHRALKSLKRSLSDHEGET